MLFDPIGSDKKQLNTVNKAANEHEHTRQTLEKMLSADVRARLCAHLKRNSMVAAATVAAAPD